MLVGTKSAAPLPADSNSPSWELFEAGFCKWKETLLEKLRECGPRLWLKDAVALKGEFGADLGLNLAGRLLIGGFGGPANSRAIPLKLGPVVL